MDILSYILARNFTKKNIENTNNEVSDIVNVLGAKNLLKVTETDDYFNGISYDVNDDGSVRIYGHLTSEAGSGFVLNYNTNLAKGKYKLTTGQEDEHNTLIMIYAVDLADGQTILGRSDENNGEFTLSEDKNVAFGISADETDVDIIIYPMCRLASIQDNTFVPYIMTNKELTENSTLITPDINLNDEYNAYVSVKQYGKIVSVIVDYNASTTQNIRLATNLPPSVLGTVYGVCNETSVDKITSNVMQVDAYGNLDLKINEDGLGNLTMSLVYLTA